MDEYVHAIQNDDRRDMFSEIIEYAIRGEFLEVNESREIRFAHNRFQEFFSSYFVVQHYRKSSTHVVEQMGADSYSVVPDNFFTNAWWKETVLFVAALDETVDDFISMIIRQRDSYTDQNKLIERLLKVEMTALAFECIHCNLKFNNDSLYERIRNDMMQEYARGDTLVKVKVLAAFSHDKSEQVMALLENALDDESVWVSERAFFILSDGQLKIGLRYRAIIAEFLRFFMEGRLLGTVIPVLKSARKSWRLRAVLPLYLFLVMANLLAIGIVGYVVYSFFEFVLFKLEWAFTSDCLHCLLTITVAMYVIVYSWASNNYPILKRFIFVMPVTVMVRYLVFNIPVSWFYRGVMLVLGLLSWGLYDWLFKKPREAELSVGSITAFVLGYSLIVPFVNRKGPGIIDINIDVGLPWSMEPVALLLVLMSVLASLAVYIYWHARVLVRVNSYTQEFDDILARRRDDREMAKALEIMVKKLSLVWAQKLFLKRIMEKMATRFSRERKMSFLALLAMRVSSVPLKDAIHQQLEDEENNFRRSIRG